jgi:hypothetical protein
MSTQTGSVKDYVGRKIDILAFQGAEVGKETQLSMVLAAEGEGGLITTGIQKLAQRFLLEFLTELGSLPYDTGRGTSFMTELRLGRIRTTIEAEQEFFLATDLARINLVNEEPADMPDDEKFAAVVLQDPGGLVIAGDKLTLRMILTSVAGDSRPIILPLRTTVG